MTKNGVVRAILIAGVLVHAVLFLIVAIANLSFPYQTHQWGEWDVLYQSVLAARGIIPYIQGDFTYATSIPYQFALPYVCALPVRLFGPHLWIGRLVSFSAFGGILLLAAVLLRRHLHSVKGIGIGLTLILLVQAITDYSLLKFHPNALSIATGMLALVLAPRKHDAPFRAWVAPVAFAVLAFFVKQTGLVFLGAVSVPLIVRFRYRGPLLILGAVACVGGISLGLNHLTEGAYGFFCYELPSRFELQLSVLDDGVKFLLGHAPLFVGAAAPVLFRKRTLTDPVSVAAAFSVPVSIYSFAIWGGTSTNFSLTLVLLAIPAARFCAVLLRKSGSIGPKWWIGGMVLLTAQLLVPLNNPRLPTAADRDAANRVGALMRESSDRVLALDEQYWAFLTGKPLFTNAEAMLQFKQAGITRYPAIEEKIRTGWFEMVIVAGYRMMMSEETELAVFEFLRENYCLDEIISSGSVVSPLFVMRPKATDRDKPVTRWGIAGADPYRVDPMEEFVDLCACTGE